MPQLGYVDGIPTLNYSNKEALGYYAGTAELDFDTTFNQIVKELERNNSIGDPYEYLSDPNNFPVRVHDERFVMGQGILSDKELRVAHKIGHVVCDPSPNPTHGARFNGSSIDVTLGKYFYTAGNHEDGGIFNPYSQDSTFEYFNAKNPETDFLEMKPWGEVKRKLGTKALARIEETEGFGSISLRGIPEQHPMVLLRPGERILGHTHEFIGILPPGTTSMQARSTTGRIGVSACYCAGWGDPGYINRWTMEIQNLNENDHIPLFWGYRIAQVIFSMTGPVATEYSKATGNYQSVASNDLKKIKEDWRPHFVLPKAYNSEVILPTQVGGLCGGLA